MPSLLTLYSLLLQGFHEFRNAVEVKLHAGVHEVVVVSAGNDDQLLLRRSCMLIQNLRFFHRNERIKLSMNDQSRLGNNPHFVFAEESLAFFPHRMAGGKDSAQVKIITEVSARAAFDNETVDMRLRLLRHLGGAETPQRTAHYYQEPVKTIGGKPRSGLSENYPGIIKHGGDGRCAGAEAITAVIDDEQIHTLFEVERGDVVIISSDFPVSMKIQNCRERLTRLIKTAPDADTGLHIKKEIAIISFLFAQSRPGIEDCLMYQRGVKH